MKKKIILTTLFFIIGISLAGVVLVAVGLEEIIDPLAQFPLAGLFWVIFLTFLIFLIAGTRWKIILRSQGINLPLKDIMGAWFAGYAFNYIVPALFLGGEGLKGYILKEKFGVAYKKTISTLAVDRILELIFTVFVTSASVLIVLHIIGPQSVKGAILAVFIAAAFLAVFSLLVLFAVFGNKKMMAKTFKMFSIDKTKFGDFVINMEEDIIEFFDVRSAVMWWSVVLSTVKQSLSVARNVVALFFLGAGIQFLASFVSLGALYISFLAPIPGELGFQELMQAVTFPIMGLSAGQGFALSIVLRAGVIVFVALGVYIMLKNGIRFLTLALQYINKENKDQ